MNMQFPNHTESVIRLDRLYASEEKRALHERMSSRMVLSAAALGAGEHVGWQMEVPKRGQIALTLFGSSALQQGDLKWIGEKTAALSPLRAKRKPDAALTELYELCLPEPACTPEKPSIGFGGAVGVTRSDSFVGWPTRFSAQFGELTRVLRQTGAVLRVVVGPADAEERQLCRKKLAESCALRDESFAEYLGTPVRLRALLLLSDVPTVRLRTVLAEAVSGLFLRRVGSLTEACAAAVWESPLAGAAVLPDYAARVMCLEPELSEPIVGVSLCPPAAKYLPASHKNARDPRAVTIGRAIDISGVRRGITVSELDLRRHYQIVGQTGTGKSTLLATMILSAIERGYGLTFFDPHGTTIDVVLRALPKQYARRVRVVRLGDAENPVPLSLWDSDDLLREERNISDLCELFGDLFNPPGECFVGPRYERWLSTFAKASIALLGRQASLESIAVLSQSRENMRKAADALCDRHPELAEIIRQEYAMDRSSDFHETLSWYLCKFQRLTGVRQLRETLGAGTNALDFPNTIDTDTVTLIDLASPTLGTHAARVVGTLLLMKLWNAVLARTQRDRTHLVIVDEASLFQTNPMPRMLAEGRKFGLSMVLCHQHTAQLSPEICDALEANTAAFSAFRLSPRDAAAAAVRFDDPEMRTLLPRLDAFRAVTTLSVNGQQTAPFTLEITRPKRRADGEAIAAEIEAQSIRTLVEPYRSLRALTPSEIQARLDRAAEPELPEMLFQEPEAEFESLCLEALDLSVRSYNCLKRAGIQTVGDILACGDLSNIRNLGRKSEEEIRQKLQTFMDCWGIHPPTDVCTDDPEPNPVCA